VAEPLLTQIKAKDTKMKAMAEQIRVLETGQEKCTIIAIFKKWFSK